MIIFELPRDDFNSKVLNFNMSLPGSVPGYYTCLVRWTRAFLTISRFSDRIALNKIINKANYK